MKDLNTVKNELQHIIFGKSGNGEGNSIQTAKAYLSSSKKPVAKLKQQSKAGQMKKGH